MAEIEIERRPRRSGWTWVALLLVLVGVAIGAWLVFGTDTTDTESTPAAEVTPAPMDRRLEPVERAPDAGTPQVELDQDGGQATPARPTQPVDEPGPDGGG